jgi:hypothetical protein
LTLVNCPADCAACDREQPLRLLAQKLRNHGLDARLTTCGMEDGHCDSVTVTNPANPQRGSLHIDDDGRATWDFPGARLDDDGIGRMTDEAINCLRANGVRLPRRQAHHG